MLFGAHVSSAGGISKAIDRVEEIRGNAVQVFTQSPRMWRPTEHAPEELERFRARRRQARVKHVSCHALYLVNLANRDRKIRKASFMALCATLETARGMGADAVVLHVGSHLGYGFGEAVKTVAPMLRDLLELTTEDLWLCMENTAGAGGTIGRGIDELEALADAAGGHPRLGVCIDSCHWWASGVDVGDPDVLDAAVSELDARLGLERLRCLHVNDSKTPLGSNRDRHEYIGQGLVGDGLATFLSHPAFAGLPAIVETWVGAADVERMRALYRRGKRRRAASASRSR
jgi:deoxyribonuclease-4